MEIYLGTADWEVSLTIVDYRPGNQYYALVKVIEDKIFIFTLWNDRYFIIDKKTGRIVKHGEGDEVLLKYADLVPLKLVVRAPQTGRTMTAKELEELEKWEADPKRRAGAAKGD
jgi:hypothetical protein